jgi:hypothetical protein
MSKNHVWVVEMKVVPGVWVPMAHEACADRGTARSLAFWRRGMGFVTRVRKYVRAGK